jgi:voltage-gated potassium channel Kch
MAVYIKGELGWHPGLMNVQTSRRTQQTIDIFARRRKDRMRSAGLTFQWEPHQWRPCHRRLRCGIRTNLIGTTKEGEMFGMRYTIAILGFLMVTMMLWDAFEAFILPRRVTRRLRFARIFYRITWRLRALVAQCIYSDKRRETYLSIFGPLSLLLLLGAWATGLVGGFAMLQWGLEDKLNVTQRALSFGTYLYLSGTTFFTLGLGDVIPLGRLGRALVVIEAGLGFSFLGAIISYLLPSTRRFRSAR